MSEEDFNYYDECEDGYNFYPVKHKHFIDCDYEDAYYVEDLTLE